MSKQKITEFKIACREYLAPLGIMKLRPLGRHVGVERPTEKKLNELIEEIVGILAGEIAPIPKSNRGAPVKNDVLEPKILEEIAKLQWKYLSIISDDAIRMNLIPTTTPSGEKLPTERERMDAFLAKEPTYLEFYSPEGEREARENAKKEYCRQVEFSDGLPRLLPLDGSLKEEPIVVPVELVREYDLHEGDVVICHTEKRANFRVAKDVLSVNGIKEKKGRRNRFEDCDVSYPQKRIRFYESQTEYSCLLCKYMDWLFSVRRGQRGCLVAPPKAGKSTSLYYITKAIFALNPDLEVFVLLLEQPLDAVGQFRRSVKEGNLVYTTYEEDSEMQVFKAEFLLKRAKSFAECGKDVVFIVDSINALARAYNDTEYSKGGKTLAGGLESKTLQYVKKYFGAGRYFAKGGSVTMLAALACDTGNPVDSVLVSELLPLANLEIRFSDELARRRVFPAIDYAASKVSHLEEMNFEGSEIETEQLLRGKYFLRHTEMQFRESLTNGNSREEWLTAMKNSIE